MCCWFGCDVCTGLACTGLGCGLRVASLLNKTCPAKRTFTRLPSDGRCLWCSASAAAVNMMVAVLCLGCAYRWCCLCVAVVLLFLQGLGVERLEAVTTPSGRELLCLCLPMCSTTTHFCCVCAFSLLLFRQQTVAPLLTTRTAAHYCHALAMFGVSASVPPPSQTLVSNPYFR